MQVREAIQSGKIEDAVQLINSHFPGLLMSNDELRFQLQVRTYSVPQKNDTHMAHYEL